MKWLAEPRVVHNPANITILFLACEPLAIPPMGTEDVLLTASSIYRPLARSLRRCEEERGGFNEEDNVVHRRRRYCTRPGNSSLDEAKHQRRCCEDRDHLAVIWKYG